MPGKYVAPSLKLKSFSCPHCGALAHQDWYSTYSTPLEGDGLPYLFTEKFIEEHEPDLREDDNVSEELADKIVAKWQKLATGVPIFHEADNPFYGTSRLGNIYVSECFSCEALAIWLHGKLLYPAEHLAPEPNEDLPGDIKADYQEASTILELSPRGAAALLILSIQKLCGHLGETGKDINADIKNLVAKGLDQNIQKALDTVRVVGNEAVHPGSVDLKDDRDTASRLFDLVNIIADAMITQPKAINALYEEKVPEAKKEAIEQRDNGNKDG